MVENKEPSFGRLVLGKAYANTKRLFADKVKDTIFGGILALPGGLISLYRYGLPIEMESALNFATVTFGPIGFVVTVVFLWNLWLAPAEIAYEKYKNQLEIEKPGKRIDPKASINWSPWLKMERVSVEQFSKILSNEDPASLQNSTEATSFKQLILQAIKSKKLGYIQAFGGYDQRTRYELDIDSGTEIPLSYAVAWAKENGFSLVHFETSKNLQASPPATPKPQPPRSRT